jgi:hypothetical protein
MPSIVLATLNARYAHASLGLRYLRANLGELRGETAIREFVIRTPAAQIAQSSRGSSASASTSGTCSRPPGSSSC